MRHGDMPRRGFLHAAEYLEQGGLSRTVFPHERDAVALVDDETDVVEERLHPELHLEVFY